MALNFPDSPIHNELFTSGGSSWRYNADLSAWESQPVPFPAWDDLTGSLNDLQFNLAPGGTISSGNLRWDPAEGCPAYGVEGGDISVGKEMWDTYTDLTAGGDLADGQAVSVVGVSGNRQAVSRTDPTSLISSRAFIGLVTNKNSDGTVRVTMLGKVHGLDTLGMTEGGLVYVGPTAGSFTQTPPAAPSLTIVVGVVEVANRNNGIINVQPRLLPRLQDLSDINGTPLATSGQIPVWNQTLKVFDYTSNILTLTSASLTDATTVGRSFFALANPSAITFPRINADNTVTALTAANFVTAIGASPAAGSSSITTVGTITSGAWTGTAIAVANGGTGGTTASVARTNLGATTVGGNLFTLVNPSAITFPRFNADNTVTALTAANFTTAVGLGTSDTPQFTAITLGGTDCYLQRDAAGVLAQRNSTNAQTFRWYYTWASAASYTRGGLSTTASSIVIAAESTSSAAMDISLVPQGAGKTKTTDLEANGDITSTGGAGELDLNSLYGSSLMFRSAETTVACSGATATATALIPAGSFVFGAVVRVTTLVEGPTSFSVGDGTDVACWGAGILPALNTTSSSAGFNITAPAFYAAATNVVLTAAGGDFTAGVVRVAVHYLTLSGPVN